MSEYCDLLTCLQSMCNFNTELMWRVTSCVVTGHTELCDICATVHCLSVTEKFSLKFLWILCFFMFGLRYAWPVSLESKWITVWDFGLRLTIYCVVFGVYDNSLSNASKMATSAACMSDMNAARLSRFTHLSDLIHHQLRQFQVPVKNVSVFAVLVHLAHWRCIYDDAVYKSTVILVWDAVADQSWSPLSSGGYRGGSPTAVQAWQPCPLWELSPSHPILL